MRLFHLPLLLSLMLGAPAAEAATFRYTFDVVSSVISFNYVMPIDDDAPALSQVEYDEFISIYHPLARFVGVTRSSGFDLIVQERTYTDASGQPSTFYDSPIAVCHDDFICPHDWTGPGGLTVVSPTRIYMHGAPVVGGVAFEGFTPGSDGGLVYYSNDSLVYEYAAYKGHTYFWNDPRGVFVLANARMTRLDDVQIAAVPLPGGLALSLGGLIPAAFAFARRRRKLA